MGLNQNDESSPRRSLQPLAAGGDHDEIEIVIMQFIERWNGTLSGGKGIGFIRNR
jgi:hypothetical protein